MAYQEQEYRKRLSLAQAKSALFMLIAINLVLFVILMFVQAIYYLQYNAAESTVTATAQFNDRVLKWFALSADPQYLLTRPWTILTHMFVHTSVWQILGNMLWLWTFGFILQDLTGNRKIFPVYIYGALGGALAFILAYSFLPALRPTYEVGIAMGASAGVMAIAAAVTTIAPGYRVFPMLNGGIPIWIVAIVYLAIDFYTIQNGNTAGRIADLAGALTGFLFVFSFRRGVDWGGWMNRGFDWLNDLFDPEKPRKGYNIKQELFYKSGTRPFKKTPNVTSQRVDEILDKITLKGYDALTDDEKELLRRAAREDI